MSLPSASRTVVSAAAVTLVAILISIYIVSQFLRNSVGVIAPNLAAELALSPVEVGLLSSTFFFVFAAVQNSRWRGARPLRPADLPDGWRCHHAVGTIVFAAAVSPVILIFGRALLGLGTAGSLVASLAVYAQRFPPERFATLTGVQVGIGTLGTLMATALAVATAVLTQIAGSMLWAPMDRLIGSHKLAGAGGRSDQRRGARLARAASNPQSVDVLWFAAFGRIWPCSRFTGSGRPYGLQHGLEWAAPSLRRPSAGS